MWRCTGSSRGPVVCLDPPTPRNSLLDKASLLRRAMTSDSPAAIPSGVGSRRWSGG